MLKFISGNESKFAEIKAILDPLKVERVDFDLSEIQEIDTKKVIEHKLNEAHKHHKGEFFIDDSSLYLSCFNYQLPGPFVKWFIHSLDVKGIYELARKMGDLKARAATYIGYSDKSKNIQFFEGVLEGDLVSPKGTWGFGYDRIFIPKGTEKTMSELKASGNFKNSPRGIAAQKLKKFLMKKK